MASHDEIFDDMKNPLSKEEWLELMADPSIFDEKRMWVISCIMECGGEASLVKLVDVFGLTHSDYRTNFSNLGKIICQIKGLPNGGENSQWWYVLAKGRYAKSTEDGEYIWILRNELKEAFREFTGFTDIKSDNGDSELGVMLGEREGAVREYKSVRYERSKKNREKVISKKGYKCEVCGFDFEEVYGPLGKDFIEVHHIKFLKDTGETDIVPEEDLACLCSNCHRMIHRSKEYLDPEALRKIIEKNKANQ